MSVYILDFKLSFDYGVQLVNGVSVLNGFLAQFMVIFSCFWSFFAAYLCNFSTFVVCLKQFLHLLSNLQVNFNELKGGTKKTSLNSQHRFYLISLTKNMLEGWDIIHWKGGIHSFVLSTKTCMYDILACF